MTMKQRASPSFPPEGQPWGGGHKPRAPPPRGPVHPVPGRSLQNQHNMWQYLYFMLHLRHKPEDEFTGQESYVHAKIKKSDYSFFPLNKSLDLMSVEGTAEFGPSVARDSSATAEFSGDALGSIQELTRALNMKVHPRTESLDRDKSDADKCGGLPRIKCFLLFEGCHAPTCVPRYR